MGASSGDAMGVDVGTNVGLGVSVLVGIDVTLGTAVNVGSIDEPGPVWQALNRIMTTNKARICFLRIVTSNQVPKISAVILLVSPALNLR